jgi:serine protease
VIDRRRIRPAALALALAAALAGTASAPLLADTGSKHAAPRISAERQPFYIRYADDGSGGPGLSPMNQNQLAVEVQVSSLGGEITHRLPNQRVIAVMLPPQAVAAMQNARGVELVEPVPEMSITGQVVPWNVDQFQARDIWDRDRDGVVDPGAPDGSGVKVCIIDSGFYAPHSDFQGMTVSGMSQISGEAWSEDGNGHGTHVAGTVNAMNNDIGVVGVLPGGAELFIVKIFNNSGVWVGGQSNLGAAANACRVAGANVISMSLGGGGSTVERDIFADLYNNHGILNVAAAGNSGNSTASFPASYPAVVSVAAIDEAERAAGFTQFPVTAMDPANPPADGTFDVVELAGGGVDVLSTWPGPPHAGLPVYRVNVSGAEYGANHIAGSGLGAVSAELVDGGLCTTGSGDASWEGKVVLCERGEVSFAIKVNEVNARGGLAAILFNNDAGNFSGTCNDQCTTPLIPAVSLSQADGQALFNAHLGTATTVTAQLGECDGCMGGYNAISGTSMATPGVAAGMGFVWDACGGPTSVSNKDLRILLRDSARDLVGQQPSPGGQAYGAGWDRVTGWGLVQLRDAMELGNARFGSTCAIGMGVTPRELEVCGASTHDVAFTLTLGEMFQGTANLSASGLPAGTSGGFSPNPIVHPAKESVYTLSGLNYLADGMYAIGFEAVDAADPGNSATASALVSLFAETPAAIALDSPADGAVDLGTRPTLSWTGVSSAASYTIEIATDAGFNSIVASETVSGTSFTPSAPLAASTTHYWRVRAANVCGNGGWSSAQSFTTATQFCAAPAVAIPDNNPAGVNSTINVPAGGTLADLDVHVRARHSWIGDLVVTLSKDGTTMQLLNRPGYNGSGFGCSGRNPDLILDDEAANAAHASCVNADPGYNPPGSRFSPFQTLAAFDGMDLAGTWTLNASDRAGGDTGQLDEWCLLPTLLVDPPENEAPIANADSYATDRNVTLTVAAPGVLGNDTDADADALTAALVTDVAHGTLSLAADGSFGYTPTSDFCGNDSFGYVANDGQADSAVATVSIDVACSNRAPVAANDSYSMRPRANGQLIIESPGPLANDTDPDGDQLTIASGSVSHPSYGQVAHAANGWLRYTAQEGVCGEDSFTYRASDGELESAPATVTIELNCDNSSPIANGNAFTIDRGTTLTVPAPGVLGNDSDSEGDDFTAVLKSDVTHGTLTLGADGSVNYVPDLGFCGSDSFSYAAADFELESNPVDVAITVNCTNRDPVAQIDTYTTTRNTTLTVGAADSVLANDSDPDGDELSALLVTTTVNGALTLDADGSFAYVPDRGLCGTDTFVYRAVDGYGGQSAETQVTLTCSNRRPVASKSVDDMTLRELRRVDIPAGESIVDPDGDDLVYSFSNAPASLSIDAATGHISGVLARGEARGDAYTIVVRGTDPDGQFAEFEFDLTVTEFDPKVFRGSFESN